MDQAAHLSSLNLVASCVAFFSCCDNKLSKKKQLPRICLDSGFQGLGHHGVEGRVAGVGGR